MTDQTSELLYMRAKLRLPGGVNSPVRAYQAVGRTPRFIQSAKGSHITDVDGNEMIDYVCSCTRDSGACRFTCHRKGKGCM